MTEYIGRGGKREGAGKPKGYKKENPVKPRKISMTDSEYNSYIKKGGAKWLRPILRGEKDVWWHKKTSKGIK